MRLRKWLSALLAAAILTGMLVLPSAAAAGGSGFTDITDPNQANAAELLRVMGVVNGTGSGAFRPEGTLTRGEFCKMTVEILGRGDEEPAQRSRTIFTDVGPNHWARGYINLASSITIGGGSSGGEGESAPATRLIMGVGDGTFRPDRVITCGEAVTILMRVLGYGNGDVATGGNWYDGYMGLALSRGLLKGLDLNGSSTLTRGQAAVLFYNVIFANTKGSEDPYLTTLGGKIEDGGILLDVNATFAGASGAVKTTTGTYRTDRVGLDSSLEGMPGQIVLDKGGKLLAFQPRENVTRRVVSVAVWDATWMELLDGTKIRVEPATPVYLNGEQKTYQDVYLDRGPGSSATIYYDEAGKISYLFLAGLSSGGEAMVARNKPSGNPFTALTGGDTDYQIYKNGIPATVGDIRQYDVATYDRLSKILHISDLRLTGSYEDVKPSPAAPVTITVLGKEFSVLPGAAEDLQNFKVGDMITLLLTEDGRVAGVVSSSAARSNSVGYVSAIGEDGQATVVMLDRVLGELKGKTSYRGESADAMMGEVVVVSSYQAGQITLNKLTAGNGGGVKGTFNVAQRTIGDVPLADNVAIYEKVGNSALKPVKYSQITCNTVPASKILYGAKDYAGRYSILVLNDVTGDQYTYGFIWKEIKEIGGVFNGEPITNPVVYVQTAGQEGEQFLVGHADNIDLKKPGGVAASLSKLEGHSKLAGYVVLKEVKNVRRSAFDMESKTLNLPDMTLPISEKVVCYNKANQRWFTAEDPMDALNQARAYAETMTIYYDKAPEDGGKVRMVVVQ